MSSLPDLYRRCRLTVNGYFAFPLTSADSTTPNFQQWREFDHLLSLAKNGNFATMSICSERVQFSNDWMVQDLYIHLLGDACTTTQLTDTLNALPVGHNITTEMAFAQAFGYWGHLSAIPAMIDMFERYNFSEDARYIAQGLSRLLEPVRGAVWNCPSVEETAEVENYVKLVRQRYSQLCDELGTQEAVVFRGTLISPQQIGERLLDDLQTPSSFDEEMRHKFEAYTGINCSAFYSNERLQPLSAAAMIEDFLESPEVAKYEEGVRYFFGHRIPD